MRLIDADALLFEMRRSGKAAYFLVLEATTIDTESLRAHGRWETVKASDLVTLGQCSECGELLGSLEKMPNFCPNCGAKMNGGVDDGTSS